MTNEDLKTVVLSKMNELSLKANTAFLDSFPPNADDHTTQEKLDLHCATMLKSCMFNMLEFVTNMVGGRNEKVLENLLIVSGGILYTVSELLLDLEEKKEKTDGSPVTD